MRKPHLWLFALFLAVAAAKIHAAFGFISTPYHRFTLDVLGPDQNFYATWAGHIADGRFFWSKVPAGHPLPFAPLYSILLAGSFRAAPSTPFAGILILQSLASAGLLFFLYAAGKRLGSNLEAWLAAGIWSLYAPAYFADACVLRESLIAVLGFAAVVLLLPRPAGSASGSGTGRVLFAGLLLGLLHLLRPTPLFWLAAIFWLAAPAVTAAKRAATRKAALILLCGFLPLLPTALYHLTAARSLTLVSRQGADSFLLGNDSTGPGIGLVPTEWSARVRANCGDDLLCAGRAIVGEASRRPGDYLALYGRKIRMLLNDYETPSNYCFYVFRRLLPGALPPLTFGFLIALAPFGIARIARKSDPLAAAWLLSSFGVLALGALSVAVQERYRYPLIPFMVLFAAVGLGQIMRWVRNGLQNPLRPAVALLLVAGLWFAARPLPSYGYHNIPAAEGRAALNPNPIREVDYITWIVAVWAYQKEKGAAEIRALASEAFLTYGANFKSQYMDAVSLLQKSGDLFWVPDRFKRV